MTPPWNAEYFPFSKGADECAPSRHAIDDFPDAFHEECGVFGVYGHEEAANLTYLGLYALQHRGQETAGIISCDGRRHYRHHGMGLVADAFRREDLAQLRGHMAVGHVRYSTTGTSTLANCRPVGANYHGGALALAHNGNLTNATELRQEVEARGAIFQTYMDTEILIHLIAQSHARDMIEALAPSLFRLRGSYSFILMNHHTLVGARDPYGVRPLALGRLERRENGGAPAWLLASESVAFDILDAEYVREVEPGEIVIIDANGPRSLKPFAPSRPRFCLFEFIYFSRPDSRIEGQWVYNVRKALGRELALECPTEADVVVSVPDSSNVAALGYSQATGIPYELGLIRSHYIGRTFIEPDHKIRHFGAKIKYNPVRSVLEGRRVVVVDDSIVRGTTSAKIVRMLRRAGAREVHFRVASSPIRHSCFYGIDTPCAEDLIAHRMTVEETAREIDADSLHYLSIDGMRRAVGGADAFCLACFCGEYFAGRPNGFMKDALERPPDDEGE